MGAALSAAAAAGILMFCGPGAGAADVAAPARPGEPPLAEEVREMREQLRAQQRQIDSLVEELRRGRGASPGPAPADPAAAAAQKVPVDEGDFDGPRLIVGLGVTLAAVVGGTVALENSGLLPAVKAANEYGASAPPPGPDAVEASGAPVPGAAEPGEESEARRLEDAVAVGFQAAREDRLLREEREEGAS